jgi:hypothetical protein
MRPRGWFAPQTFRPQARAFVAQMEAMHTIAPIGEINCDRVLLDLIDFSDRLDSKALYLIHYQLPIWVKLSESKPRYRPFRRSVYQATSPGNRTLLRRQP